MNRNNVLNELAEFLSRWPSNAGNIGKYDGWSWVDTNKGVHYCHPLEDPITEQDWLAAKDRQIPEAPLCPPMSTPNDQVREHNHYFKDVEHLDTIDVYRVLELFNVTNPCVQHSVKKQLCAGSRGTKDTIKDYKEAIDSLNRAIEMLEEDKLNRSNRT